MLKRKFRLFTVLTLLFFTYTINAQSEADSLYKVALISVYDKPEKAIQITKGLIEKQHKNNPKKQIQCLLLLSSAYSSKRDYEKSLKYAQEAQLVNEKIKSQFLEIQILNKIAAQYHELGVNDKALEYLDKADFLTENYKFQDSVNYIKGNNYAIRGFIYREQLNCDIAIEYLNKSYNVFSQNQPQNIASQVNRSVVLYNLGNCYAAINQFKLAQTHFDKAYELASISNAKSLKAFSKKGKAEVYTLQGNYLESVNQLNQAISISKDIGDLILNRGIYKGMTDNYLALKDWDNYQNYRELYNTVSKQIKATERKIINSEIVENTHSINEQIAITQRNYWIYISLILVVFISVIISIALGQFSFQKKYNTLKSKVQL